MNENHPTARPARKGFIIFCERKLRYEGGLKAWLFFVPYLLGALVLDVLVDPVSSRTMANSELLVAFLAYLILFPVVWRKVLRFIPSEKTAEPASSDSSGKL